MTRIAQLESALEAERERARWLEVERDKLKAAYRELQVEHELLRRRIFAAKAERVDTSQLELELAERKKELDELAAKLGLDTSSAGEPESSEGPKPKRKPKGRRNLLELIAGKNYPTEAVEVPDPEMRRWLRRARRSAWAATTARASDGAGAVP